MHLGPNEARRLGDGDPLTGRDEQPRERHIFAAGTAHRGEAGEFREDAPVDEQTLAVRLRLVDRSGNAARRPKPVDEGGEKRGMEQSVDWPREALLNRGREEAELLLLGEGDEGTGKARSRTNVGIETEQPRRLSSAPTHLEPPGLAVPVGWHRAGIEQPHPRVTPSCFFNHRSGAIVRPPVDDEDFSHLLTLGEQPSEARAESGLFIQDRDDNGDNTRTSRRWHDPASVATPPEAGQHA